MCLDNKARYDLDNLPWKKIKFMGGQIAIHAPRHKENQTINQARLAYSDGGPGLNNVDRKVMWKMYDRERDYNWVYDITAADPDTQTAQDRNTASQTLTAGFKESSDDKRKIRFGQVGPGWKPDTGGKYFPQLVKLSVDDGSLATTNGDRLYESMNDHALSDGALDFPMVGWPYYIRNPNKTHAFNDLKINALSTAVANSRIADMSFVGLNYPTMSELWYKNREMRAAKIQLTSGKDEFDLLGTTHYKNTLSINSKAASHTSSHCAMIHVPPLP
jgi:hypothetical protein